MTMASSTVEIQTSPQSVPSMPSWMGELTIVAYYLTHQGLLERLAEHVRFARARFGIYDTIDFVVVLIGYAVCAEPTLKAFYERLLPFAIPFMALFGRDQLPDRSTLSRFLKAIDQPTVEALRSLFQEDLTCRGRPEQDKQRGGLQDCSGEMWEVFDADGTRQAARQRALPRTEGLPPAHRRLDQVCAAGYTGRKRGEVVRTRTTLLQAHTQQWFGTFGNAGNGEYRGELLRVIGVLMQYAAKRHLPLARIIVRLDGQYGVFAVIIDLASHGVCYPTALRLTEFAQAQPTAASGSAQSDLPAPPSCSSPASLSQDQPTHSPVSDHRPGPIYGPAEFARTPRPGKFAGTDFQLQPDGTVRCPANRPLYAEARRPEPEGTVRVLYAARLPDCQRCPLRQQCLG